MCSLEASIQDLSAQSRAEDSDPETEARVQRVLNGLRPPVSIDGQPPATLTDRMKALCVPGVSIAVIRDAAIDWARGYGMTGNGDDAVSASTLFQAASISKPVSAVAALTLVQAGRFDLDTEIGAYLKSWRLPPTPFTEGEPVTVRRLLNHTAGTTVHGFGGYPSGSPVPTLSEILDGVSPANSPPIEVDEVPGTRFRYSGGGYTILQQTIDDITGQSFPDFLREAVLVPIGMTRSSFEQPLSADQIEDAALPHDVNGNILSGGPHIYTELAAAGLWTTATDLAHFALGLRDAWQEKPGSLLSSFITQQMFLPGLGQYGLGMIVVGNPPHERFYHDGANAGYRCVMLADADGNGAVVMTNSDNGHLLIWDVVRSIANEHDWYNWPAIVRRKVTPDPNLFAGYVGIYRLSPTAVIRIFEDGGRLFSHATDQDPLEIFPQSSRVFFATEVNVVIVFDSDGSTPAARMIVHQNGRDVTANRIP